MPAGRLELPKASKDRLVYSQVQLPLCDAGQHGIQLSNNKRSESFRTQSAETARSLSLLSNCCFEILGAGESAPADQLRRREQSENLCSADFVLPMVFT